MLQKTIKMMVILVYRLFYDTIKGGDYRSREANAYRLAEGKCNIIDQCVVQGVPFAREYGGTLDNSLLVVFRCLELSMLEAKQDNNFY